MLDRLLARRTRLPRFVNRAIDHVADHPMGMLGRLAARRLGRPSPTVPSVSTVPADAPIRVLIAPVNYSGQGRLWAAALQRANPRIAARNLAVEVPGGFSFSADVVVPIPDYANSRAWQQAQFEAVSRFSHVLIEAEEPIFGRLFGRDTRREVDALAAAGIDVAFMAHGTDLRLPSGHRTATPWSPYRDPSMYSDRWERVVAANIRMLADTGRPVFVSTPDLLKDAPAHARWCPVVVDPTRWSAPATEAQPDGRLRVAHAPTSALIKGTHLIEPVLRDLDERGVIRYLPITGVPSAKMPSVYAAADVVLDQFRIGSYGVAACEAMAAGRAVVSHVTSDVRGRVADATGLSLPILEATPDTLEQMLISLADDRRRIAEAGRAGAAFVSDVHDGRRSAAVLLNGWLEPAPGSTGRGL